MVLRHTTSSACLSYFLLPSSHLRLLELPFTPATTQDCSILIPLSMCSFSSQMQVMEVSENPKPLMREYRRLMNTAQESDQFPAYPGQVSGSYPAVTGEFPKPDNKKRKGSPQPHCNLFDYINWQSPPPCISI